MGQSATFSEKTKSSSRNGFTSPYHQHCLDVADRQQDTVQLLQQPPTLQYLLDLALEDYFFFWGVKEVLADAVLTLKSLRRSGKRSSETSALTSSPLSSGGSWTAATSASGSTMDTSRNIKK
jgi:hypothetical protein